MEETASGTVDEISFPSTESAVVGQFYTCLDLVKGIQRVSIQTHAKCLRAWMCQWPCSQDVPSVHVLLGIALYA